MSTYHSKLKANNLKQTAVLMLCCLPYLSPVAETSGSEQNCGNDNLTTIAFVGDLIFQGPLQKKAMSSGSSYRDFWSAAESIFRSVDAVYGNVEGTISSEIAYSGARVADPGRQFESEVYSQPTSLLNFNYHSSLARDLGESGFRIVSTGNNHALDRGSVGVDQTIEYLEENGVTAVGTRSSRNLQSAWGRVVRIGSMNVGWVACTYGTNGIPDPLDQVLDCYDQKAQTLRAIADLNARVDIDAVFFVPHWGIENQPVVERRQEVLAKEAIEAGATAIVGTHPHLLQEWQWISTSGGRVAPIVYSTGNFISAQSNAFQRTGLILLATLQKPHPSAKAVLTTFKYITTEFTFPPGAVTITTYDPTRHALLPASEKTLQTESFSIAASCK